MDRVNSMSEANICIVKQVALFSIEEGGYDKVGFTCQDIRNKKYSLRLQNEGHDAQIVIEHFDLLQKMIHPFILHMRLIMLEG